MATALKNVQQLKPLPAPNSDFYDLAETLNAEELALVKQGRAFIGSRVAPILNKYWADDAPHSKSSRLKPEIFPPSPLKPRNLVS